MRTIAIMNNKGGVGKTVTAINLADILVRDYRQRVILVDCDGQMNLTRFFVPDFDPEAEYTMVSLLEGDGEALWSDNLLPVSKDLRLIPGSPELYTEDLEAVMEGQDQVKTRRVANFVDCARKDDGADFIIFDCPPGFTAASLAALLASDEVVIPMELDGFSVSGVVTMRQPAGAQGLRADQSVASHGVCQRGGGPAAGDVRARQDPRLPAGDPQKRKGAGEHGDRVSAVCVQPPERRRRGLPALGPGAVGRCGP